MGRAPSEFLKPTKCPQDKPHFHRWFFHWLGAFAYFVPLLGFFLWASKDGLSQAALDDMLVEGQPADGTIATSPIGTSLRRAKNRRRWGAPVVEEQETILRSLEN